MSLGTDTSVDTSAGMSPAGDVGAGASGYAAAGASTPGATPTIVGGGASAGWLQQLSEELKNPENIKALGDAIKSAGTLTGHAGKMDPMTSKMFQHVLTQGMAGKGKGGGAAGATAGSSQALNQATGVNTNPYLGDALQALSDPTLAKSTLKAMGIPFGG